MLGEGRDGREGMDPVEVVRTRSYPLSLKIPKPFSLLKHKPRKWLVYVQGAPKQYGSLSGGTILTCLLQVVCSAPSMQHSLHWGGRMW